MKAWRWSFLFGWVSDRRGRRAAMTLPVARAAGGSFVIGLCPAYEAIGVGASLILLTARLPDLVDSMLGTGVRIGEACALRWSAVDPDAGTPRIDATLIRVPGQGLAIQDLSKTTAGRRTIALPAFVVDLLRRRQATAQPAAASGVVFPSPKGPLRDSHNTSADLRKVLGLAGFRWVTSHVFRKTVATRLDEAGLSARQIVDQLGHNRPSLTQDVYLGRGLAGPEAAAALQRLR